LEENLGGKIADGRLCSNERKHRGGEQAEYSANQERKHAGFRQGDQKTISPPKIQAGKKGLFEKTDSPTPDLIKKKKS